MRFAAAALLLLASASPLPAGEIPGAQLVLEVVSDGSPGRYPEAAPPRFVLLDKGVFYVGGSDDVATGRLDTAELKALDLRLERLRKLPGLGSTVVLGSGRTRYRLQLLGKRPLEITGTGSPADAPAGLQPLTSLLAEFAAFDHPTMRFIRPDSYLLQAREGPLVGGCRPWTFDVPAAEAANGRVVPAAVAADWPRGVNAASACAGDKRYVVTLRPLVPGERP